MENEHDSTFEREQLATAIAFSEGTSVDLMTARSAVSADVITAVEERSTVDSSGSVGEVKAAETQKSRFTSDFLMSTVFHCFMLSLVIFLLNRREEQ
ncbi:hypothetical protein GCK32_021102 [Trichostrongylus colubriformis]|uniref:Uncharacterized protein n=1 Tax=Trichostrongylus colubriformis TaxID=6319 RepID=A0AAN8IC24_TRICO